MGNATLSNLCSSSRSGLVVDVVAVSVSLTEALDSATHTARTARVKKSLEMLRFPSDVPMVVIPVEWIEKY